MKLQNFAENRWISGNDDGKELMSAVDGRPVAAITSSGIDFAAMLDYARQVGGANLRRVYIPRARLDAQGPGEIPDRTQKGILCAVDRDRRNEK